MAEKIDLNWTPATITFGAGILQIEFRCDGRLAAEIGSASSERDCRAAVEKAPVPDRVRAATEAAKNMNEGHRQLRAVERELRRAELAAQEAADLTPPDLAQVAATGEALTAARRKHKQARAAYRSLYERHRQVIDGASASAGNEMARELNREVGAAHAKVYTRARQTILAGIKALLDANGVDLVAHEESDSLADALGRACRARVANMIPDVEVPEPEEEDVGGEDKAMAEELAGAGAPWTLATAAAIAVRERAALGKPAVPLQTVIGWSREASSAAELTRWILAER